MGLTPGALLFAIFCALWTSTTAFVAGIVGSLYLQKRRRLDFISILSYVVVVAMLASVGQQVYTIAQWDEVKAQERQDSIHMAGRKHSFDIGSNKFVQAFYYIQMICYHIAAGLCAFWCCFLWANVWLVRWYCRISGSAFMTTVKWSTITAACVLMGISRISYFSDKPIARFIVGNIILIAFLTAIPIFLFLILYRYLHFRLIIINDIRRQKSFNQKMHQVHSLPDEPLHGITTEGSAEAQEPTIELKSFPREREGSYTPTLQRRTTFGSLLMVRFVGAILVIGGLGIFHVFFQITQVMSTEQAQSIKEIPLTTMAQIHDTYLFLPATCQGWLLLLVFGTTEDYWGRFKALLGWIFCLGCLREPLFSEEEHDTRQDRLEGQPGDLDRYMLTLRKRDTDHGAKQVEGQEATDDHTLSATREVHKNLDSARRRSFNYVSGHVNVTHPHQLDINRRSTLLGSLSKPLPHLPSSAKTEYTSEPLNEPAWKFRSVSYL